MGYGRYWDPCRNRHDTIRDRFRDPAYLPSLCLAKIEHLGTVGAAPGEIRAAFLFLYHKPVLSVKLLLCELSRKKVSRDDTSDKQ
jgi:hypothetical protein